MKSIPKIIVILVAFLILGVAYIGYQKSDSPSQVAEEAAMGEKQTNQEAPADKCEYCPEMLVLQGNDSFLMGDDEQEQTDDDLMFGRVKTNQSPRHKVQIKEFAIGRTEVTQEQWQKLMGNNPTAAADVCSNCPVSYVNMSDIQEYIARLNQKTGKVYRLPSEAEWEYAAMGGFASDSKFYKDEKWSEDHVWSQNNSGLTLRPVASKNPNNLGVYDLLGSVWEWVQDCYHSNYTNAPMTSEAWFDNSANGVQCERDIYIVRGGSVIEPIISPRHRGTVKPDRTGPDLGFRLAMTL